jgi:prevent-host-death family protein
MDKAISAADANRGFSQLLREVKQGRSYVVTSHGQPVARISPAETSGRVAEKARASLIARLRGQKVKTIARWTRDELYEDAE